METFLWITSVWGVYLAFVVFVVGMAWRVWTWIRTPKSPVRLGMYPKPKTKLGRFGKLLKDTFVAPAAASIEPRMYFFSMMFHLAALAAFVGHLRLFGEYPILPSLLGGKDAMNTFANWAGSIAGVLMMLAVMYWIGRRLFGPYKNLSVPEDYLLLFVLFMVIVMGNHLRFAYGSFIHADTYQAWFKSLVALKPAFPDLLKQGTVPWALGGHMLFVDLLLIYFPFSKLTHAIGALFTNLVRSE